MSLADEQRTLVGSQMRRPFGLVWVLSWVSLLMALTALPVPAEAAPVPPDDDPFYRYDGGTPLEDVKPGTVLKTRTGTAHLATLSIPVSMVQVLYRTTDAQGRPMATVASVLKPLTPAPTPRLLSYQSFYDSTTNLCQPSYVLNGGLDRVNSPIFTAEQPALVGYLAQGYTIVTSDFEGQDPAFATGPQYGRPVLDGIRAASDSPEVGLPADVKVALLGYSGGSIASEWAVEYAPTYAPDVNDRLVGVAMGGLLVHPLHNLSYVSGSLVWSGIMPLAVIGIARAYDIDPLPFLNDRGRQAYDSLQDACIGDAIGHYPGVTIDQMLKPEYALGDYPRNGIPDNELTTEFLVPYANKLIMGTAGTPTIPMRIRMGTGGLLEGTQPSPSYGQGDGVMLPGDVRSLARKYCETGIPIDYAESPLSHMPLGAQMLVDAGPWMSARFTDAPPPNNCDSIAAGNDIAPGAVRSDPTPTPTPTPSPSTSPSATPKAPDDDTSDSDNDQDRSDSDDDDDDGNSSRDDQDDDSSVDASHQRSVSGSLADTGSPLELGWLIIGMVLLMAGTHIQVWARLRRPESQRAF